MSRYSQFQSLNWSAFCMLTMSNVALGLSLESGHLASLARLPGITYLRTCNTALTQMYSRKGLRHFCSKVHSSQIDFILVFMYFSIVSAPGHFCIAALYKFSMYCIVLVKRFRLGGVPKFDFSHRHCGTSLQQRYATTCTVILLPIAKTSTSQITIP